MATNFGRLSHSVVFVVPNAVNIPENQLERHWKKMPHNRETALTEHLIWHNFGFPVHEGEKIICSSFISYKLINVQLLNYLVLSNT